MSPTTPRSASCRRVRIPGSTTGRVTTGRTRIAARRPSAPRGCLGPRPQRRHPHPAGRATRSPMTPTTSRWSTRSPRPRRHRSTRSRPTTSRRSTRSPRRPRQGRPSRATPRRSCGCSAAASAVFGSYAKVLLEDDEPAGYAQFGPLSAYPRALRTRELYPRLPVSPLPATITCIATTRAARDRGLAATLVEAVCDDLAGRGFAAVETYPEVGAREDATSAATPGVLGAARVRRRRARRALPRHAPRARVRRRVGGLVTVLLVATAACGATGPTPIPAATSSTAPASATPATPGPAATPDASASGSASASPPPAASDTAVRDDSAAVDPAARRRRRPGDRRGRVVR